MTLQDLLGIDLPIVQAPMAGVQGSALAVAVSNAGGLGSLPCALLGPDALRKELAAPAKASRRDKRAAEVSAIASDADAALLAALKALRAKLAQAQKVPAYVVFSDRTLIELATHRPANPRAMREIHGVGDTKLERYGAAFLDVVQNHAR